MRGYLWSGRPTCNKDINGKVTYTKIKTCEIKHHKPMKEWYKFALPCQLEKQAYGKSSFLQCNVLYETRQNDDKFGLRGPSCICKGIVMLAVMDRNFFALCSTKQIITLHSWYNNSILLSLPEKGKFRVVCVTSGFFITFISSPARSLSQSARGEPTTSRLWTTEQCRL
jgi:hypothetical protein